MLMEEVSVTYWMRTLPTLSISLVKSNTEQSLEWPLQCVQSWRHTRDGLLPRCSGGSGGSQRPCTTWRHSISGPGKVVEATCDKLCQDARRASRFYLCRTSNPRSLDSDQLRSCREFQPSARPARQGTRLEAIDLETVEMRRDGQPI